MTVRVRSAFRPVVCVLLALGLAGSLLAGCATFKSTTRLDVGPFAENTVGMIGEVQRATKPVVWTYLKQYESLPSVWDVRSAALPFKTLLRGVALYSAQVVSIYESDLPEPQKAEQLARYLEENVRSRVRANTVAALFISQGRLDSAVTAVRKAPTFLAALGEAQPVVSAALSYGNHLCDSLTTAIDVAASDVGSRIDSESAPLREQLAALTDLQLRATRGYTLISRYRLGDNAALDSLRAQDLEAAAALPAGRAPAPAALDTFEKLLLARIETMTSLRADLDRQFAAFQAQQQELDALRNQSQEIARMGRITLMLWARSHRNLAEGIRVPAAIDVMGMMKSAAGQATKVIL